MKRLRTEVYKILFLHIINNCFKFKTEASELSHWVKFKIFTQHIIDQRCRMPQVLIFCENPPCQRRVNITGQETLSSCNRECKWNQPWRPGNRHVESPGGCIIQ